MQPVRGRGEQAVGRLHGCPTRVEQEEAARPIGGFDHARVEASLSDERCLLVARHSADAHLSVEESGGGHPERPAIVSHFREERLGNAEEAAKVRVPSLGVNVIKQRPGGIGGIGGVNSAARQPPEEEAVDRAERQVAPFGLGARIRDIVENPGQLRGGEIGIEQQAGLRPDLLFRPFGLERSAKLRRPAILPDDGAVDRLTR